MVACSSYSAAFTDLNTHSSTSVNQQFETVPHDVALAAIEALLCRFH